MYVVYNCVGGTHSSAIAAAIHLGILSPDRTPSKEEVIDVPYFDTLEKKDQGKIIFRGIDENHNKVFTLSRQFVPELVIPDVEDAFQLGGGLRKDLLLVDTMPSVNLLMKIGGFSSRRLHWVSFGRPIVALGVVKNYHEMVKIVKKTLNSL